MAREARLQADTSIAVTEIDEVFADRLGMALDDSKVHDLAVRIDDADGSLFHGDIEADMVLVVHGGLPRWIGAPSCRGCPPGRARAA